MLLGLVALTLASLGLYGVISYAVSLRAREIGIRLALGAHSTNVRALIIRQGMLLTAVGLAVGLIVSLMATPVLQSMLINLPATDFITFVGVSGLLIAIALVACYVPARRATRIDPCAALRAESFSAATQREPRAELPRRLVGCRQQQRQRHDESDPFHRRLHPLTGPGFTP